MIDTITNFSTTEFYKYQYLDFIKERKKIGKYKKVLIPTMSEYSKIVGQVGDIVMDKILNESLEYRLPCHLGYLSVKKFKQTIRLTEKGTIDKKNLLVDWGETWKLWFTLFNSNSRKWVLANTKKINRPLLFHYNNESNGWVYKYVWNKYTTKVKNYKLYKFFPTRLNKAALTKAIKDPKIENNYQLFLHVRLD